MSYVQTRKNFKKKERERIPATSFLVTYILTTTKSAFHFANPFIFLSGGCQG